MKIGVIADDLTGAFDTGVQFRNWGLSVEVLIGDLNDSRLASDVIVVNTESRLLDKDEAYSRVYHSTEKLMKLGVERLYKKIDSTLRGNIGAEIDAVMEASQAKFAFFAPAYPTYGRTTLDGKQLLENNPIETTEYSDELCAKTSEIAKIISTQSKRMIGLVDYNTVKLGADAIAKKVKELKKNNVEVALFDALTDKNLIDVAYSIGDVKLLVGSAGFASEVPLGLGIRKIKPMLSICGSTKSLSKLQINNLIEQLGFKEVEIEVMKLIEGDITLKAEMKRCINASIRALKEGIDVSLTPSPKDRQGEGPKYTKENGVMETDVRLTIERAMGEIASEIIKETEVFGLILTGGATTLTVCNKLDVNRAHIIEEIEPGIPLLMLSNGIPAVTKAGGFGTKYSLARVAQRMRRVASK